MINLRNFPDLARENKTNQASNQTNKAPISLKKKSIQNKACWTLIMIYTNMLISIVFLILNISLENEKVQSLYKRFHESR